MDCMSNIIVRKIEEVCSGLFRGLIYPFKRLAMEISTKSIMKQGTYINKGTRLCGRNFLGRDTYLTHTELGFGSYVSEKGRLIDVKTGRYCSIGPEVFCAYGKHPTNYLSTHPAFYSDSSAEGFTYCKKKTFEEESFAEADYKVVLGNDVWLGARVTLLEGIKVGDGAIIAAGAVVCSDVEPYSIYGGVPAKKIRDRFTSEQISELSKRGHLKWWEMKEEELEQLVDKGIFGEEIQ